MPRDWPTVVRIMSKVGHHLHFGYAEQLEMPLDDWLVSVEEAGKLNDALQV